ncbi:hypothetical protein NQ317_015168 [Molorchus minor]|uniref:Uncharacterized protein n=1 Tax=Molorchus minor TaxID=1323400 RepID=A0ABQ9K4Y9_9CUCU|nr:hypothetical protein NQ317_015168 [Molorchus minor]
MRRSSPTEDKKLKERVEARNELESYAYSLKNQLSDKDKLGAKLSEDEKTKMEEAIDEEDQMAGGQPGYGGRGLQEAEEGVGGGGAADHREAVPGERAGPPGRPAARKTTN